LSGERVLIAEDEYIIALELQSIVEQLGAVAVGPAASVDEALSLAAEANISCAILDARLLRRSVEPVARCLAARGIPFLFYTGQSNRDPAFAACPDAPVLAKPAPPRVIAKKIQELLSSG